MLARSTQHTYTRSMEKKCDRSLRMTNKAATAWLTCRCFFKLRGREKAVIFLIKFFLFFCSVFGVLLAKFCNIDLSNLYFFIF